MYFPYKTHLYRVDCLLGDGLDPDDKLSLFLFAPNVPSAHIAIFEYIRCAGLQLAHMECIPLIELGAYDFAAFVPTTRNVGRVHNVN